MVAGEWQVVEGDHVAGDWAASEYLRVVNDLQPRPVPIP
jgi:hypothetical protein